MPHLHSKRTALGEIGSCDAAIPTCCHHLLKTSRPGGFVGIRCKLLALCLT